MKAIFTLILVLFICLLSHGQERKTETKVVTVARELVPVSRILMKTDPDDRRVARLYRRPHTRVKKALTFTTRENRPKVA